MDLQSWSSYSAVYEQAVELLSRRQRERVRMAEVGVWKGASISRLAALARAEFGTVRPFEIVAVDDWCMDRNYDDYGDPDAENDEFGFIEVLKARGHTLHGVYDQNLRTLGFRDLITDVQADSVDAATRFADGHFDLVFLDGDHSYDGVCRDLRAWRHKAKILAGHDLGYKTVEKALDDVLGPDNYCRLERCNAWTTDHELAQRVRTIGQSVCLTVPATPYGGVCVGTVTSILHTADSRRDVGVRVGGSSLLTFDFNNMLCLVLNDGSYEWFVMLHSDVAPVHPSWLDDLLDLAERHGADVMSVALPIKNTNGLTSTAIDTHPWRPRRLTIRELVDLPETFGNALCRDKFGGNLLVNTGCMAVRVGDWLKGAVFDFSNAIIKGDDGRYTPYVEPEDWKFSRWCHANEKRVVVTRAVPAVHYGHHGFTNCGVWGQMEHDEINAPQLKEAPTDAEPAGASV